MNGKHRHPFLQMTGDLFRLLSVPLLLATASCRAQSTQEPPEITLPDGDVPGMQSIDGILEGSKGMELMVANFSGVHRSDIIVDGHGGLSAGDGWGYSDGGMTISIPKDCRTPFYVRVEWTDSRYTTSHQRSQAWGGGISYYDVDIYKSKLVKVEGPIPSDARAFLVIFYPHDRIVCEMLGEHPGVYERIDALKKQKGHR